ncbi:MAG TPA: tetratricopeptide repeat protein [Polyangia bacterium]|nr:tetratricopeptide repeat protein [Polyangia bacterium]
MGIAIACALGLSLPIHEGRALAAGLTAKDTAKAKEARQLYKAGQYEAAANIFLRLSSDYPGMLVLTRNLGACYYYLHRPEPALSNLREYLQREQDITPEDRREVETWIAEMEKLRSQMAATSKTPVVSPAAPSLAGPAAAPPPVPSSAPSAAHLPIPPVVEPAPASPPSLDDSGKSAVREEALDVRQKPAEQVGAAAPESGSRWWLWTGIGAVVAGGIVTAVLLSTRSPGRDGSCSPGLNCIVVGQ